MYERIRRRMHGRTNCRVESVYMHTNIEKATEMNTPSIMASPGSRLINMFDSLSLNKQAMQIQIALV